MSRRYRRQDLDRAAMARKRDRRARGFDQLTARQGDRRLPGPIGHGRTDDELLSFEHVVLTPHMAASPRTNGLQDIADMIQGIAQALAA